MNLTESNQRALTQLVESGLDKSMERLAKISRTKWEMQTVSLETGDSQSFKSILAADNKDYYGTYFWMPEGFFIVLFSQSGLAVADAFISDIGHGATPLNILRQNAMAEIANIVANAVAGTLADACEISLMMSSPQMARGKKKELFNDALAKFKSEGENCVIMSYVHMTSSSLATDCTMLMAFDNKLTEDLRRTLDRE